MKKLESLNKFKKHELKNDSLTAIMGGTGICTTFRNGTKGYDNFDDKSKGQGAGGGWPADDLLSTTFPGTC
jgi:hypothetical protein